MSEDMSNVLGNFNLAVSKWTIVSSSPGNVCSSIRTDIYEYGEIGEGEKSTMYRIHVQVVTAIPVTGHV